MDPGTHFQAESQLLMEYDQSEASSLKFLSGDDKIARVVREYLGEVFAEYLAKKGHDTTASHLWIQEFLVSMLGKSNLLKVPHGPFGILSKVETERTKFFVSPIVFRNTMWYKERLPTILELKTGEVRELTEGVFIKKKDKGVLELYISQE